MTNAEVIVELTRTLHREGCQYVTADRTRFVLAILRTLAECGPSEEMKQAAYSEYPYERLDKPMSEMVFTAMLLSLAGGE